MQQPTEVRTVALAFAGMIADKVKVWVVVEGAGMYCKASGSG